MAAVSDASQRGPAAEGPQGSTLAAATPDRTELVHEASGASCRGRSGGPQRLGPDTRGAHAAPCLPQEEEGRDQAVEWALGTDTQCGGTLQPSTGVIQRRQASRSGEEAVVAASDWSRIDACSSLPCLDYHWVDAELGRPCYRCPQDSCGFCHCGQHLLELQDTTRGKACAIASQLRVWLLAGRLQEGGAGVACVRAPCGGNAGPRLHANWHVPLGEREVLLPEPRVRGDGGPFEIIASPIDLRFYLCRVKSRVPKKKRLPSASRERQPDALQFASTSDA